MNPFYGPSKNPWDPLRISGGSSGGSVVATASGMVPMTLGTDTGGSILLPSSFCGVIGLKPTYGRVSRHGVIPFTTSMDHVGCITKTAWDAGAVMECIAGQDLLDHTSASNIVPPYTRLIEESTINGLKVGVPKNYFLDCLHPEIQSVFSAFVDVLKSLGLMIQEINLTNTDDYYKPCINIARAQAAETHWHLIKTRLSDFSEDSRTGFKQGMKLSAVRYIRDLKITAKIRYRLLSLLKNEVDVFAMPTTFLTAPRFNESKVLVCSEMLNLCDALNRNNIIFDCVGFPSINVPAGLTRDGPAIGVQLVGGTHLMRLKF